MPVPRQRLSARRGRTRASHHGLVKKATVTCPNCSKTMLPHRACPACGFYKGRNIRPTSPVAKSAKVKSAKKATKKTKTSAEPVAEATPPTTSA